ncbi:hypothetical protein SYNTR_1512 [Candidatus Syntrophocurvum alkaliphilum]|uniref:Flp pilus assembly protein, pilin Flp n=1 Tax=Candidatus Syntrophocurvum alkaliphilum TaxID=2293317 RepID=A0A6I6DBW3_9FIRM|nr:Flp family type IVb pilin [Candidatus Syntrophocurvum alkaliphilum]QGU00106.1 hypothetical protein SYNTR_1512 [Candidatus Syntrophocurvum alkaliphilum]
MLEMLKRFINEEQGQGMVEYAFILAFIALAVVSVLNFLGDAVNDIFVEVIDGF